jgi:asparagine synthase (glutamine-hydrolysing)
MCGIAGIVHHGGTSPKEFIDQSAILGLLKHRGPDHQAALHFRNCSLYHSRLSIVDTSSASNQPFTDTENRHALVFNGEIFNFRHLEPGAISDVQVLFHLLIAENKNCLKKLNGFFSFAFFDYEQNSLLLARDRLGIKPLYYYSDGAKFAFASELKPLLELVGPQEINEGQLHTYFRLNYCTGRESIFKNIFRLLPGETLTLKNQKIEIASWYTLPDQTVGDKDLCHLSTLLEDAVRLRLNADVPVGTFLSGGLDSSLISAIAAKHHPALQTFSIGFKGEKYFDETKYAEAVAKHIGSNHHAYLLGEDDFINQMQDFLQSMDEPFADSSAFNFYLLSKFTSQKVKVALSGDGADELFKGYKKHRASFSKKNKLLGLALNMASPILPMLNTSRNSKVGNLGRQIKKLKAIQNLDETETFKYLASISNEKEVQDLLLKNSSAYFESQFMTNHKNIDLETILDLKIVLADDMLVKADRFSMRNGIEIRNPFLDYRVVEFALQLNNKHKISRSEQKIILRDQFRHLLPQMIFDRRKKGFELPLHKWLSGVFSTGDYGGLLNPEKIIEEGLIDHLAVQKLRAQLNSANPADSAARLWAIIVFESWLQNYKQYIKTNA